MRLDNSVRAKSTEVRNILKISINSSDYAVIEGSLLHTGKIIILRIG